MLHLRNLKLLNKLLKPRKTNMILTSSLIQLSFWLSEKYNKKTTK